MAVLCLILDAAASVTTRKAADECDNFDSALFLAVGVAALMCFDFSVRMMLKSDSNIFWKPASPRESLFESIRRTLRAFEMLGLTV